MLSLRLLTTSVLTLLSPSLFPQMLAFVTFQINHQDSLFIEERFAFLCALSKTMRCYYLTLYNLQDDLETSGSPESPLWVSTVLFQNATGEVQREGEGFKETKGLLLFPSSGTGSTSLGSGGGQHMSQGRFRLWPPEAAACPGSPAAPAQSHPGASPWGEGAATYGRPAPGSRWPAGRV